ncbi:hypothetical protein ABBQ38_004916 [Trebouxia sp. C0009 RCD-2024]
MVSPSAQTVLNRLKSFVHARTMQDHWKTYMVFHENVRWDAPPILLNGREKLRVVAYFAKRIAKLDFTEHDVRLERSKEGVQQVSTDLTFIITLLPELLRLPKIKVNATVKLGVTDDFQTVTSIYGRLHRFPCLPDVIRRFNALCLGTLGVVTEKYWGKTVWLYGDDSYQHKPRD